MQVSSMTSFRILKTSQTLCIVFRAFTRAITVHCIATQRKDPTYHVKYREALDIADRTAQQYQIFLGSETLPRLLLRNLTNASRN